MYKTKLLLLIAIVFLLTNRLLAIDAGYFGTSSNSEYLNISKMNDEFGITSLMNSAISNDFKAAKIFIASGDSVNKKNTGGATALHLAARNNALEVAEILVANGASVNSQDNEGWTPLMRACLNGNLKIMATLMNNGANPWLKNKNGETCLMHAAMADCYECGRLVLNVNNNPLIDEQIKNSIPIVAKRYNEPFMKLLKEGGKSFDEKKEIVYAVSTNNEKKEIIYTVSTNNEKTQPLVITTTAPGESEKTKIYNFSGSERVAELNGSRRIAEITSSERVAELNGSRRVAEIKKDMESNTHFILENTRKPMTKNATGNKVFVLNSTANSKTPVKKTVRNVDKDKYVLNPNESIENIEVKGGKVKVVKKPEAN